MGERGYCRRWLQFITPTLPPLPPVGNASATIPVRKIILRGAICSEPAARQTCCIWGIWVRVGFPPPVSQLCPAHGGAKKVNLSVGPVIVTPNHQCLFLFISLPPNHSRPYYSSSADPISVQLSSPIIPHNNSRVYFFIGLYISWLFRHPPSGYPISDQLFPPPIIRAFFFILNSRHTTSDPITVHQQTKVQLNYRHPSSSIKCFTLALNVWLYTFCVDLHTEGG